MVSPSRGFQSRPLWGRIFTVETSENPLMAPTFAMVNFGFVDEGNAFFFIEHDIKDRSPGTFNFSMPTSNLTGLPTKAPKMKISIYSSLDGAMIEEFNLSSKRNFIIKNLMYRRDGSYFASGYLITPPYRGDGQHNEKPTYSIGKQLLNRSIRPLIQRACDRLAENFKHFDATDWKRRFPGENQPTLCDVTKPPLAKKNKFDGLMYERKNSER